MFIEILGGLILSVFIAEVFSAMAHWAEDRYGNPAWEKSRSWTKRKIYQYVIGPNILHHKRPYAMTEGSYWQRNNSTIILSLILAAISYIIWPEFWPLYLGFVLMTQANEIHSWQHLPKSRLSWPIRFLQNLKIIQTHKHHKIHHTRPYSTNYGIMTNVVNPVLSAIFFWQTLEFLIWFFTGISPVKEREVF